MDDSDRTLKVSPIHLTSPSSEASAEVDAQAKREIWMKERSKHYTLDIAVSTQNFQKWLQPAS